MREEKVKMGEATDVFDVTKNKRDHELSFSSARALLAC